MGHIRHKVESSLGFGAITGCGVAIWAYVSGWAWADVLAVSLAGAVSGAIGWQIWVFSPYLLGPGDEPERRPAAARSRPGESSTEASPSSTRRHGRQLWSGPRRSR